MFGCCLSPKSRKRRGMCCSEPLQKVCFPCAGKVGEIPHVGRLRATSPGALHLNSTLSNCEKPRAAPACLSLHGFLILVHQSRLYPKPSSTRKFLNYPPQGRHLLPKHHLHGCWPFAGRSRELHRPYLQKSTGQSLESPEFPEASWAHLI